MMAIPRSSKLTVHDLAVFGGLPAFDECLYVNRPNLANRRGFLQRLDGVLDRRWFTNGGQLTEELEKQIASYLGVRHCVVTCNGTVALQLAIQALGISGQAIVPSFTFISLPHSLLWLGIEPVFCDIDRDTWNIDPYACERLITPRTSTIIGVHLWGRACDIERLEQLAATNGLTLVFDAAHAFGCGHAGSMIGGFGEAEIFSFHATKIFHTFEGGAITTNNQALAERLRLMRNFGFTGYDQVKLLGTNAKMPESSAAMGLANFEVLHSILDASRECYQAYVEGLNGVSGINLLRYEERAPHNYQYVVLEVDEETLGISRDQVLRILHSENILARRYFYPGCHRMEPYATRWPEYDQRLPHTNNASRRVLVLPGGDLAPEKVSRVCGILRLLTEKSKSVRRALGTLDKF